RVAPRQRVLDAAQNAVALIVPVPALRHVRIALVPDAEPVPVSRPVEGVGDTYHVVDGVAVVAGREAAVRAVVVVLALEAKDRRGHVGWIPEGVPGRIPLERAEERAGIAAKKLMAAEGLVVEHILRAGQIADAGQSASLDGTPIGRAQRAHLVLHI